MLVNDCISKPKKHTRSVLFKIASGEGFTRLKRSLEEKVSSRPDDAGKEHADNDFGK